MPKCKGCGAEIIWIKTPAGKNMPCDPVPVPYWDNPEGKGKVVTDTGAVISCDLEGTIGQESGMGRMPHWSTCPKAADFRTKA